MRFRRRPGVAPMGPSRATTAASLGPAISYAAAHPVQLISVDTIVGVGKVYIIPLLTSKHLTGKVMVVSDDGVPFEMQMVSYAGDANQLWGNVCGKAHGGVCSSSAA
jgi:hypothetical protein